MGPCSNNKSDFENMYALLYVRSLNGSAFLVPDQRPQPHFETENILGTGCGLISYHYKCCEE